MFFYRHYNDNNIIYTKDLLFEKTNFKTFNTVKGIDLVETNFLPGTGLRKVVPLDLRYIKNNFRSGY